MNDSMYRELKNVEAKRALKQPEHRTQSEVRAYRLPPKSMRCRTERNPPIAFSDCKEAYFPDFLLRKERICIEIDGIYHKYRKEKDVERDIAFKSHGFIVIRILNEDVVVDVVFWERLLEGLELVGEERTDIKPFIVELRQMINDEINSWTKLNPVE